MISLSHLNKLTLYTFFFIILGFGLSYGEEEPADIWKKNESQIEGINQTSEEKEVVLKSPILSEDINKIVIKIDENKIEGDKESIIGIFDPEENNFDLNMWSQADGEEIKKILKRINKLKLSKLSEDLLFSVLFTNAYPPKVNLSSEEFLNIKINWLIKKKKNS